MKKRKAINKFITKVIDRVLGPIGVGDEELADIVAEVFGEIEGDPQELIDELEETLEIALNSWIDPKLR